MILHGSRGVAGGSRPDSDIDLSLIIDTGPFIAHTDLQALLFDVLSTTLTNWEGAVEADLAAVYDIKNCGLTCFDRISFDESACAQGGFDCFGLYKIQKGFNGFVTNAGIEIKRMVPCLKIWSRSRV
jgi:hypothetical protein